MVEIKLDAHKNYPADEILIMYIMKKIRTSVWSAIFKKQFILSSEIEFEEGCSRGEDVEFMTRALARSEKTGLAEVCPYTYVIHDDIAAQTSATSREASLRRYSDNAGAICRAARYVAEHSTSPKARDVSENLLLPEGLIKTLNAAAKRNDPAAFFQTLYAPETRRALLGSRKYALQKPEVFLKAASLLLAPRIYFSRRAKP